MNLDENLNILREMRLAAQGPR